MNTNTHQTQEFMQSHALAALNVMAALADPILEGLGTANCKNFDTALRAAARQTPSGTLHESELHRFRHLADELAHVSAVNGETSTAEGVTILDADAAAAKATVGTDASVKLADALFVEVAKKNPRTSRAISVGNKF